MADGSLHACEAMISHHAVSLEGDLLRSVMPQLCFGTSGAMAAPKEAVRSI
jgi:hypothetical protein